MSAPRPTDEDLSYVSSVCFGLQSNIESDVADTCNNLRKLTLDVLGANHTGDIDYAATRFSEFNRYIGTLLTLHEMTRTNARCYRFVPQVLHFIHASGLMSGIYNRANMHTGFHTLCGLFQKELDLLETVAPDPLKYRRTD